MLNQKIPKQFLGHIARPLVVIVRNQTGATVTPQTRKEDATTKKNTAKTAIACALASALTLGSFCAPALAQTQPAPETGPTLVAQGAMNIDEIQAYYIAYTFLGIDHRDIEHITADAIYEDGNFFYEVEIETKNSYDEYHVVINAYNAQVVTWWVE